jgi:NADH-quinone oxidoreductase subunit L
MPSLAWLILWLPLVGFAFNAVSGFLIKDLKAQKRVVSYVAPGVVLIAFAVTLYVLFNEVLPAPDHRAFAPLIPWLSPDAPWINFAGFRVNFGLLLDPLSMLMAMIVTGVGGLIHVYATGYMADDREQPRFFTYFNLFIFMMLLLVMAENFLLLFVGWEGVGTCSYLLIGFWYTDVENAKAGNKAFIVNRIGDVGFTLGMMATWSVFGTLSFFTPAHTGVMDLAAKHVDVLGHPLSATVIGSTPIVTVICILLFIGAMGKSAQIPLWVWLPDAMAGPTPVSALIHAATMVTAGVVMVTRCSWLFVQAPDAMQLVAWIGVLTALMAATIALVQNDIKRVLAYSTISQLGYMFLACGVGNFAAGMFHVTTHAFFKALLFLGSGAVIHSMHGEQDMRKMGGLKSLIPRTWAVMFVGTYAIAGFPLMSGFWSKDEILHSASMSSWGNGVALYAIGLATAFLTAFYMNRLMWKTFYTDPQFVNGQLPEHHHGNFTESDDVGVHGDEEANHRHQEDAAHGHAPGTGSVHESPPSMMWPLYILAILSIGFGWYAGPFGPNGGNLFEKFLEPSVASLTTLGGQTLGTPLLGEMAGYVLSGFIAIAGLAFAYMLYNQHRKTGELLEKKPSSPLAPYNILLNKWYWDDLYNKVFIGIGGWIADRVLWRGIDMGAIDGFVNGLAGAVGRFSSVTRRVQTGYVRNYALAMLFGAVILVAYLLMRWNQIAGVQ